MFLGIFLAALVAQALVGHSDFNNQQLAHQDPTMSLGRYLTSSAFTTLILATITSCSAGRRSPSPWESGDRVR